ncbi:MAG: glycoside hydrolase family 32 protein [Lacibacter sp.]
MLQLHLPAVNKIRLISTAVLSCCLFLNIAFSQEKKVANDEQFRPLIHFSPAAHWINDPNGMVYYNGVYHLFFQYHPYSSVWGPMHWGHATSKDLVHWKEQPIAIYPDSIGTIFSGSTVVDKNNTSGFGKNQQPPLVAVFTQHNEEAIKKGRNDFQNQSLAYSNDGGKTWTKYSGNPVLRSPGIRDFRDPKVIWHEVTKKWIMALAVVDKIYFYSSPDLKSWTKESDFSEGIGAHGGVWECPDLFPLSYKGKTYWVLIVNINPGGPNSGSATQYFIGDFDGKKFTPVNTKIKWMDYGPDEYAGVTWSNTGSRRLFMGWMSNWDYANVVPTTTWRNAMTVARELSIKEAGQELYVASTPVAELSKTATVVTTWNNMLLKQKKSLLNAKQNLILPCSINMETVEDDFVIRLSNTKGEEVLIGYSKEQKQYFIDRTKAGISNFHQSFATKHTAPRFANSSRQTVSILIDVSSIELFADDGLTVMTSICFPAQPYNQIELSPAKELHVKRMEMVRLK